MITTDSLSRKTPESVPESRKDEAGMVLVLERPNGCIVRVPGQEDKFYLSPEQAKQDASRGNREFYYQKWTG